MRCVRYICTRKPRDPSDNMSDIARVIYKFTLTGDAQNANRQFVFWGEEGTSLATLFQHISTICRLEYEEHYFALYLNNQEVDKFPLVVCRDLHGVEVRMSVKMPSLDRDFLFSARYHVANDFDF